jgi:hypothetical protein
MIDVWVELPNILIILKNIIFSKYLLHERMSQLCRKMFFWFFFLLYMNTISFFKQFYDGINKLILVLTKNK